ncbi:MAG: hypothetical protein HYZ73_02955, partial [Elusimicrobia bacterium]|nr:hypothetical protein [Elusimicrobiota bacterium]
MLLFLSDYLGMIPTLVGLHELAPSNMDFLTAFFQQKGVDYPHLVRPDQFQIREALAAERPDIILGSHYERAIARSLWEDPPGFVGLSSPIWGSPRLTFRPLMGLTGTLTLVEEILAALEQRAPGALIR